MQNQLKIIILLSVLAGVVIAWIDSRPGWDDTGITVGLLLLSAFILGFAAGRRPWLIACAISIWIPALEIWTESGFASLIALIPAFAGAYSGFVLRRKTGVINKLFR